MTCNNLCFVSSLWQCEAGNKEIRRQRQTFSGFLSCMSVSEVRTVESGLYSTGQATIRLTEEKVNLGFVLNHILKSNIIYLKEVP